MTNSFIQSGLFGTVLSDPQIADAFTGPKFLEHMVAFEIAWTDALGEVGAVPREDADAAMAHIETVSLNLNDIAKGSNRDGLPVPDMVAQLKVGQPSEIQAAIHVGATSQDILDTAMVLTLQDIADVIGGRLATLVEMLGDLEEKHGDNPLMGRTRMQAALPITVGSRIATWRTPLANCMDQEDTLIDTAQIGGAVGLRNKPEGQGEAVAGHVAHALGLDISPVWHADRTGIIDFGHWLTKIAGTLGKIGQDITLMAQQGVDEVTLSGGGGSSAMPHKQNPIKAEAMVTLARYVAVQQGGLAQAMIHEQERSGAAWALEWMILPSMCEATGAALNCAADLINQIERIGTKP